MTQRMRDPVYGLIPFGRNGDRRRDETDGIAWRLLNAREFQRLRRIRQLGFSDLVFPGATHSRFAHCVGVYDDSALKKILIKPYPGMTEPMDIAEISAVVKTFRETERLWRVYAPEANQADELRTILEEVRA